MKTEHERNILLLSTSFSKCHPIAVEMFYCILRVCQWKRQRKLRTDIENRRLHRILQTKY